MTMTECATVTLTWKQLQKRLEGAAKGTPTYSRKPTAAHPFAACFGKETHTHWTSGRITYGYDRHAGSKSYRDAYGEQVSCVEHIARSTGQRDWAEEAHSA